MAKAWLRILAPKAWLHGEVSLEQICSSIAALCTGAMISTYVWAHGSTDDFPASGMVDGCAATLKVQHSCLLSNVHVAAAYWYTL